jgi:hypothetical protein
LATSFAAVRNFAAGRGFKVVETYSDAAVSGSYTEREQLKKLLRSVTCKFRRYRRLRSNGMWTPVES